MIDGDPTTDKLDRLFDLYEAILSAISILSEEMADCDTAEYLLDVYDSARQDLVEEMGIVGLTRYDYLGRTAQIIKNRLIITRD